MGITEKTVERSKPVPRKYLKNLGELLVWIYGSRAKGKEPLVQRQYPDLNLLREAIGSEDALAAVRSGRSLARASEVARGDETVFRERLSTAKDSLIDVGSFVTLGYHGEQDLMDTAADIRNLADDLYERMDAIRLRPSGRGRRQRLRAD